MNAVEMKGISKQFGTFKANNKIDLIIEENEIHAILGENGAGKSTLMNLLFGIHTLDEGEIYINQKLVNIQKPTDAFNLGIGMVHQHFQLVEEFTVLENIILGKEGKWLYGKSYQEKRTAVVKIIEKYKFDLDLDKKIKDLSVGEQQKVEIIKVLYRQSNVLIFDEPTGVLTPQETEIFLRILKTLKNEGKTIIIITHKLNEIKEIADRCTIIRQGEKIETVLVSDIDEMGLATMMVGHEVVLSVDKGETIPGEKVLELKDVTYKNGEKVTKLKGINLDIYKGKILGIAGVDNNGQADLVDVLTGLNKLTSGVITYFKDGKEEILNDKNIREINQGIIAHIPQDRQREGLVLEYDLCENSVLVNYHQKNFTRRGILNKNKIKEYGQKISQNYDVRSSKGLDSQAVELSGGNQQKLIVGREIESGADVLIAFQPTRGVDVGAIEFIHNKLLEEKQKGRAVILISMELNEILSLSDDIAVMHDGYVVDVVDANKTSREEIGLLMVGKGR